MTPHELKALNTRLTALEVDLTVARDISKDAQRKESALDAQCRSLRAQITEAKATAKTPTVTEHAILRFLERVYGIDVEQVRQTIMDEKLVNLIDAFKSGKFPLEGYDCAAVVKDRTVVTIVENA